MRSLELRELARDQCSGEGLCLHRTCMLLGSPADISQPSILKPQSFVLWISLAGDLCVLSGYDVLFLLADNGVCNPLQASGISYSPLGPRLS